MKKFICCVAAVLLALFFLLIPLLTFAGGPHTGFQGQAFLYLTSTQVQLPMATCFNVLSARTHRVITRVVTDQNGMYELSINPGTYLIVPETMMINAALNCTVDTDPFQVTVKARQFTPANIFYFRESLCTVTATP
jgi:hypothetical protein